MSGAKGGLKTNHLDACFVDGSKFLNVGWRFQTVPVKSE